MEDHPLLSDLCSSCNTSLPKYRCPRCSSRTCSLPCYKRHQRRACCSGKRDPAAYLPRSKLATPTGIDHDYNFLAAIERDIQQPRQPLSLEGGSLCQQHRGNGADAVKREKDLTGRRDGRKNTGKPPTEPAPGSNMKKRLDACGVFVERLPAGMSRQLENRTMWQQKRKRLIWTIEWVHPDGSRDLRSCPEDMPVQEAYEQVLSQRANPALKRQKRKQGTAESLCIKSASPTAQTGIESAATPQDATGILDNSSAVTSNLPHSKVNQEPNTAEREYSDSSNGNHNKEGDTVDRGYTIPEECFIKPVEATVASNLSTGRRITQQHQESLPAQPSTDLHVTGLHDGDQTEITGMINHARENDDPPKPQFCFFLRHPHMCGSTRVLIPLSPTDCLATALSGQVILEFPTVQVFPLHIKRMNNVNKPPEFMRSKQNAGREVVDTDSRVTMEAQYDTRGERHNNDDEVGEDKGDLVENKAAATASCTPILPIDGKSDMWDLPAGYVVISKT